MGNTVLRGVVVAMVVALRSPFRRIFLRHTSQGNPIPFKFPYPVVYQAHKEVSMLKLTKAHYRQQGIQV